MFKFNEFIFFLFVIFRKKNPRSIMRAPVGTAAAVRFINLILIKLNLIAFLSIPQMQNKWMKNDSEKYENDVF